MLFRFQVLLLTIGSFLLTFHFVGWLISAPKAERFRRVVRYCSHADGWVAQWYNQQTHHWNDIYFRGRLQTIAFDGPIAFARAVKDVEQFRDEVRSTNPHILLCPCRVINRKRSKLVMIP